MWKDPVIEELHEIRAQISREHGDDLHRLVTFFQSQEKKNTRQVLSFPPKRPAGWQANLLPSAQANT